jgi:allophanate hydrolase subunit 1
MTPKEKAEDLVDKLLESLYDNGSLSFKRILYQKAKQCAIITVDEMISQMLSLMIVFNEDRSEFEAIELDYLNKVKQEIEEL